jgi:ATP-dependent helicase HepA
MWKLRDAVRHRHNPELGIGIVVGLEERTLVVEFAGGALLRFAALSDALLPGAEREADLVERLALGDQDPVAELANRLDALHLLELREAGGLGSFLGGRIRLFAHQLYAAERAAAADPVRWLLADEVGLGKTIEACLILNRLVLSGRARSVLVVAPATLTVQWLGELWRKHHQVFVLLDEKRLADVARDFGPERNPFEVHTRAVVALETLVAKPHLTRLAVAAGIDLLIVDEAHHLRRPPGHAGDPAWRAVAPVADLGRHVVLLTATPFEDDVHGFFRLLQMLRPAEFPEAAGFESRLARADPLPPCTSSTRRVEIGGLPPRVGRPAEMPEASAWQARLALEAALREIRAPNPLARKRKLDRLRRALSAGAALAPVLGKEELELRRLTDAADAGDPRLAWLAREARTWKQAGEKTLVFVAGREALEWLRTELSHRAQLATALFHEELSPARRDIEVAQFRRAEGPSLLVSTECGGEGRNFEFCHRLVLFDLPWNPVVVEQRIGRLDRIGRSLPVEIVYFRPPTGIDAEVARLYEALGLFREPLAGLEPELGPVQAAIEQAALDPHGRLGAAEFDALVDEAERGLERGREAAYQQLHREPYRAAMAEAILERVPPELEALNEDVVVAACEQLGFRVEERRGRRCYSIEFGSEALVDSLPGVQGGASFVGTFDRATAVADESLDFFAAGHPLLEAVLLHMQDAASGRVAALGMDIPGERGLALVAFYKEGPAFEAIAVDDRGRRRPVWAALLRRRPLRTRRVHPEVSLDPAWATSIRRLAAALPKGRRPVAVAALVLSS